MTIVEGATANAPRDNRKAIPVSCGVHKGPRGFTNLVVERKPNGDIVLDPHVTGECVIILDKDAATTLFDVLGTWLLKDDRVLVVLRAHLARVLDPDESRWRG